VKIEDAPDPPENGIFVTLRNATEGEAVVRLPRTLGNEGDGVSSVFPTCWVVAESEAQRVNKTGIKSQNSYLNCW